MLFWHKSAEIILDEEIYKQYSLKAPINITLKRKLL